MGMAGPRAARLVAQPLSRCGNTSARVRVSSEAVNHASSSVGAATAIRLRTVLSSRPRRCSSSRVNGHASPFASPLATPLSMSSCTTYPTTASPLSRLACLAPCGVATLNSHKLIDSPPTGTPNCEPSLSSRFFSASLPWCEQRSAANRPRSRVRRQLLDRNPPQVPEMVPERRRQGLQPLGPGCLQLEACACWHCLRSTL